MNTGSTPGQTLPGARQLWLLASGWFLLNALSPLLFSRTAETDQAAELVRSQLWQWGYGSQPPLYTWLAKLLLQISGPALWPLLLLKAAILSGLAAGLLSIGRQLQFSRAQQWISVVGLALIPQFAWESQRDLTHSVLATLLAALTLLQLLRLEARPSPGNYALAGAISACGILSKYTFGVFLLGTLVAALSLPAFRRRLLHPGILIALAVFTAVLTPHLLWAVGHPELALSGTDKLQSGGAFPLSQLQGLGSAASNAVAFLTPLWIVGLVLIDGRPRPAANQREQLLYRLPLAMAMVLSIVILVSGATRIKDRWYQSLLFYAPVVLAVMGGPSPQHRRLRGYLQAGVVAAVVVSVALPGRIPLADALGRTSNFNAPLMELLEQIQRQQGAPGLVIASDSFLGGNARRVFADVPVIPARALPRFQELLGNGGGTVLLLAADDDRDGRGLDGLLAGLAEAGLQPPAAERFTAVSAPARWAPRERHTLFVLALPASDLKGHPSPASGASR
jgi:4-amino-4-deoxy-L-arabinose transferase-like glycosyltransferase